MDREAAELSGELRSPASEDAPHTILAMLAALTVGLLALALATVLQPLWHLTGFALGMATALLGTRAAMACTVGVEEVIDEHYRAQAERLGDDEPAMRERILAFRTDELRHRDAGLAHGAAESLGFEVVSAVAKTGSRLAIWLSTRF